MDITKSSLLTGVCAIALSALSLTISSCHHDEKPATDEFTRVETIAVTPSEITSSGSYTGTVTPTKETSLSFAVPGTISQINVRAGDRVARGALIGTVDDTNLRNAYDIARSTYESTLDAYNRMKLLHDDNSLADMKWVEIQNALKQAESAQAIARKSLDDVRLTAPFAGYISEKYMDAGMNAAPGIPVVRLVSISPLRVSVSVPEADMGSISIGQPASVTASSMPGQTFPGRVVEKGIAANPLSRSYEVKIEITDTRGADFLPGMMCEASLTSRSNVGEQSDVIVLPPAAVLIDAHNRNFVWLDSASTAIKRYVNVRGLTDRGIIIQSGLNLGDSVITAGQEKVSSGMKVKSINR